jgi:hypothetical protein
MDWLKDATDDINAIEEMLKAWKERLEKEPKENWQASMAYEWVERMQDGFIELTYHLERIANHPKPANFKHWRDKDFPHDAPW